MSKNQDPVTESKQQQQTSSNAILTSETVERQLESKTESSTTQLIERNVKQIQIKEESTVKKILRTREIKHHAPDEVSPESTIPSSSQNETQNDTHTSSITQNRKQFVSNNHDLSEQGLTASKNDPAQQYGLGDSVQIKNDNAYSLRGNYISNNEAASNYQNLAGLDGLLPDQGLSVQNENYGQVPLQPMRRTTSHNSNMMPSGYEELDTAFNYMDQQQNMGAVDQDLVVNTPYGYSQKNDQPTIVQGAFTQNNVTYMTQPSTYDTAYGTTGLVVQVPASVAQNIYGTNNIEPIYALRGGSSTLPQSGLSNVTTTGLGEIRWRDPDISEVIAFLKSPDATVRANSVAYLQHLSYMDDIIKEQTRMLGGIPILVELLNRDLIEVQRNVCGALRNLSYGRKNDENKRAIRDALGIQALVRTLVNNPDNEIRELATSVLWNLSSCEEIKWSIIDDALSAIVSVIIVPYTSWFRMNMNTDNQFLASASETHWSTVFRNATGMIRNISSAGAYARKQLRECEGLIESIFFIIKTSIARNDVENKLVENCVCLLRNLSYRCQETQDPDYDKHFSNNSQTNSTNSMQTSPSSPTSSTNLTSSFINPLTSRVSENFGCFSFAKKSKYKSSMNASNASNQSRLQQQRSAALLPPHHPSHIQTNGRSETMVRTSTQLKMATSTSTLPRFNISEIPKPTPQGKDLLWQIEVVKPYLALLSGCSNYETLEAAAGAIQNLAACFWQPSIDIRAAVRKEKGLPVLVELLRMDVDPVVCVVATALRNLAIDQRNKELIGKYAMPDLVSKLPNGQVDHDRTSSDDTVAAVLATLHEVISNNADFARSLYEAGGLNRLTNIIKNKQKFSLRVQRFSAQVLLDMWKFTELREIYKKGGWKESHFVVRSQIICKNSTYSVNSNTIERPIASQHADRSSSTRNLRAVSSPTMIQMPTMNAVRISNDMNSAHGAVSMTNFDDLIGDPKDNVSTLYAQVDRQRKRNGVANQ